MNNRNLPTNPDSGGIPAMDKIDKTAVMDTILDLLNIFKLFSVLIFFVSYKKIILKKR